MIVCVRMYACVITVADSLGVLRGRFSSSKPFQNECFSVMKTYNLGKYNPIQSNPQILNLTQNLFMSTILVDSYFNRLGNCAHLRMHPYIHTFILTYLLTTRSLCWSARLRRRSPLRPFQLSYINLLCAISCALANSFPGQIGRCRHTFQY